MLNKNTFVLQLGSKDSTVNINPIKYGKLDNLIQALIDCDFELESDIDYLTLDIEEKLDKNNIVFYKEEFEEIEPWTEEISSVIRNSKHEAIIVFKIKRIYKLALNNKNKSMNGDDVIRLMIDVIKDKLIIGTKDIEEEILMVLWHVFISCQIFKK